MEATVGFMYQPLDVFFVSLNSIFRFLEQGEVEQIAMMKPKAPSEHEDGMLEFLEDIIGSSRFKVPIDQLAKRVEELNELRGEKVYILIIRVHASAGPLSCPIS